jgi:hypothetical protein
MGRQIFIARPCRTAAFPRAGEPIVPRLLREVVIDRHAPADLSQLAELGAEAWVRHSTETCRRMALSVVDRVQTRLEGLPERLRATPLPGPATMLNWRLEPRTANTLRRALATGGAEGSWTLGRYVGLPRFGGRAVVDLLVAVEAHGGRTVPMAEVRAERELEATVAYIARNLPISETRVREQLTDLRSVPTVPIGLSELARTCVRRGQDVRFRVVDLGGARIAVGLSEVTAARAAYAIATRAVAGWGAASTRAIAAQIRAAAGRPVEAMFVERLLSDLPSFRWLDRCSGWFWLVGPTKRPQENVRRILAAKSGISMSRLRRVLLRSPGDR